MRRLLACLALATGLGAAAPTIEAARPAWISGCSSWRWSNDSGGYSALCTSGNAKYFAKATCYGVGGYVPDFGTYVWPGTRSDGHCPSGYYVTSTGWTQ